MSEFKFNELTGQFGDLSDSSTTCSIGSDGQLFGGAFIPPPLIPILNSILEGFLQYKNDQAFNDELQYYLREYIGRPYPLTLAKNLSQHLKSDCKIYLKREDLNHTGSHKINNVMGQILLARRLNYNRIICDTGAGQHGVAVASRQSLNVFRMKLLGAQVVSVDSKMENSTSNNGSDQTDHSNNGSENDQIQEKGGRLRDAVEEAFSDLMQNYETSFYLMGSAVGPHPYPMIVKHFQSIISIESLDQVMKYENRLPSMVIACCGGGSNAIGSFAKYIDLQQVKLIGVEPIDAPSLTLGKPYIMHGFKTLVALNSNNEPMMTRSISSGLDHPAIGPEHAYLKSIDRCEYHSVGREQVLHAFQLLSKLEGIIPALESAHAVAYCIQLGNEGKLKSDDIIIINISGRGDKDVEQVYEMLKNNSEFNI